MADEYAVQTINLHKRFGELVAVQGINLVVERGEILGLLGPNGAGKSTTISMLSCLLQPTAGDALVMGHSVTREPQAVKANLGVVPQEVALYPDLSARENLDFWGKMYGLRGAALRRRVDEVLDIIGLADRQRDRVAHFSGGMKRRVNIGVALLHKPALVIMDEPTVGIDPQSRRHILDNVVALNAEGVTVLYTTHYMEEAQELSHHIAIMDRGQVIAYGTHDELVKQVGELDRIDVALNEGAERVAGAWRETPGVRDLSAADGMVSLLVEDSDHVLPRLFEAAAGAGVRVSSLKVQEPNLETLFLQLTGRALRD